ncbi:MAG TPA: TonB-dependent receptor, partial [Gammaproteobacteria bacterium]|nr:TonB-dependent receptor [Gammaproteobacteria bacterium]
LPSLGAALRVSVFHGDTNDIVSTNGGFDFVAGLFLFTPVNIGQSTATGLEISIKGSVGDQWRWGASYTPMTIDDHFAPGFTIETTLIDFEHMLSKHVVNANVGWSRGPWEVDAYLRYQSSFAGVRFSTDFFTPPFLAPISDYISIDARVAYELNDRMTLALAGQNITRSEQRQTSSSEVERRLLGTFSISF